MRLPNAADAVISSVKIREYLLSRKHPIGMHKASFFEALGYTEAHWRRLGEDLRRIITIDEDDMDYSGRRSDAATCDGVSRRQR